MTEPHVRPATRADLAPFAAELGGHRFLADRYRRQRDGRGVLFLAFLAGRPAGDVYLWLERAEEQPIRTHLPGVALLTHLEVHSRLRNRGVGRALVGAVERYLSTHGHQRVALAVRTDNTAAARLYRRLGYRDWGHNRVICYAHHIQPDGRVVDEAEECVVMVKTIAPILPSQPGPPMLGARQS